MESGEATCSYEGNMQVFERCFEIKTCFGRFWRVLCEVGLAIQHDHDFAI